LARFFWVDVITPTILAVYPQNFANFLSYP
jgi:hypothetical protein